MVSIDLSNVKRAFQKVLNKEGAVIFYKYTEKGKVIEIKAKETKEKGN